MPSRSSSLRVAVIVALALALAACGQTKQTKDPARDVAKKFAAAVSAGKFDEAAAYTTNPDKATSDLTFTAEQLEKPTMSYTLAKASASTAEASVEYDVVLTVLGREVPYKVDAMLVTDNDGNWKVDWKPSVIHPKLTNDTHLQIVANSGNKPMVLDRNGQPVLGEELVTVIRIDPSAVTDAPGVASALSAVLSATEPSLTPEAISQQISDAKEPFSLIALREQDASQIQIPDLPGISYNKQARLLTAAKSLRSPALNGLKGVWEQEAAKSTGWSLTLQDAKNQVVEKVLDVPAAPVTTIPTTFDANLQAAAQAAVDKVPGQAVVVALQPSTGGVLAVAQNAPADAEGPIALTGQYPPGSTFKVVTTAAALSAGITTPNAELACPGKATIKGRTIPNDEQFDLGTVPLHTAFAHSCNTTLAALAVQLPKNALHHQALSFGLGVDYVAPGLTTISGKIPVAENDAEVVEGSIGQGKDMATPFGMALVAATVAKGSTPLPVIVTGATTTADQTPAAPSEQIIADLRSMMLETVQSGTAKALSDIPGLAGKTGTAQFGDGVNSHGWFIGYTKDLAFAVFLAGANSSKPAVTVAGDFLRAGAAYVPQ